MFLPKDSYVMKYISIDQRPSSNKIHLQQNIDSKAEILTEVSVDIRAFSESDFSFKEITKSEYKFHTQSQATDSVKNKSEKAWTQKSTKSNDLTDEEDKTVTEKSTPKRSSKGKFDTQIELGKSVKWEFIRNTQKPTDGKSIFIIGYGPLISRNQLFNHFSRLGTIKTVRILEYRYGDPRSRGIVQFEKK